MLISPFPLPLILHYYEVWPQMLYILSYVLTGPIGRLLLLRLESIQRPGLKMVEQPLSKNFSLSP